MLIIINEMEWFQSFEAVWKTVNPRSPAHNPYKSEYLTKVNCKLNFINQAWYTSFAKVMMQHCPWRQGPGFNSLAVVT